MKRVLIATALLALGGLAQALTLEPPAAVSAQPGDFVTLAVAVSGGGASAGGAAACEQATLRYTPPVGWTAVSEARSLCLSGQELALVAFQVPLEALAGSYSIPLRLEGAGGAVREALGSVQVGQTWDFLLLTPGGELPFPRRPENYKVELSNLSNAPDTYLLEVKGVPCKAPNGSNWPQVRSELSRSALCREDSRAAG